MSCANSVLPRFMAASEKSERLPESVFVVQIGDTLCRSECTTNHGFQKNTHQLNRTAATYAHLIFRVRLPIWPRVVLAAELWHAVCLVALQRP